METHNTQYNSSEEVVTFKRRPLIPTAYGVALFFFFFTFFDIKCGQQTIMSVSGLDLMTGFKIDHQVVGSNIWVIIAFVSGIIGLAIFLIKHKYEAIIGLASSALSILTLLYVNFNSKMSVPQEAKQMISIEASLAYWLCLGAFIVAGVLSYLQNQITNSKK